MYDVIIHVPKYNQFRFLPEVATGPTHPPPFLPAIAPLEIGLEFKFEFCPAGELLRCPEIKTEQVPGMTEY